MEQNGASNGGGEEQLRRRAALLGPPVAFIDLTGDDFENSDGTGGVPQTEQNFTCLLCHMCYLERNPVSIKCGHVFCEKCIQKYLRSSKQCPICKRDDVSGSIRRAYLS